MEKRQVGADDRDAALGPAPSARLLGLALGAVCPMADFFDSGEA